jgi:hypothetical protein
MRLKILCFILGLPVSSFAAGLSIDQHVTACKSNYQMLFTSLKLSMKETKDPAADRLPQMDQLRFCQCYGSKNFEMMSKGTTKPDVATVSMRNAAACAQSLLRLPATPQVNAQPMNQTGSSPFQRLFSSRFESGKGIGGLTLNSDASTVNQVLGKADNTAKGDGWETLMYGPNLIDFMIQIRGGKIASIKVGRTYKGQTDRGIRIGDTYESVKKNYGSTVPLVDEPNRNLLYPDGTQYQFKGATKSELHSISVVDPKGSR